MTSSEESWAEPDWTEKQPVYLTKLEMQKIRACIRLANWDAEQECAKRREEGNPDYDLLGRVNFYDALAQKFEWK